MRFSYVIYLQYSKQESHPIHFGLLYPQAHIEKTIWLGAENCLVPTSNCRFTNSSCWVSTLRFISLQGQDLQYKIIIRHINIDEYVL